VLEKATRRERKKQRIAMSMSRSLLLWNVNKKAPFDELKLTGNNRSCSALFFSPDGRYLAAGGFNSAGQVRIWLTPKIK